MRLLIRSMEGGEVSPWLRDRQPGDTLRISPPFGWFRPGQDIGDAPFVFIATGTGIAPFLSYQQTFKNLPVCALEGMVNDVGAWLGNHGVSLMNIHREVFFHG